MVTTRRLIPRLLPVAFSAVLWAASYWGSGEFSHPLRGSGWAVHSWRGRILLLDYRISPAPGDEARVYAGGNLHSDDVAIRLSWRHVSQGPGDPNIAYDPGEEPTLIPVHVAAQGAGFATFDEPGHRGEWVRGCAIPYWAVTSVAALPLLSLRLHKRRAGVCPGCGYDLTGNVSGVCPECGAATAEGGS